MNKLFFGFAFLVFFKSISQINVSNSAPYNTPQNLVQNVLLGGGVVASNFTYNGDPLQIGFFNGTNSNIGLDSGIVLCSDDIATIKPTGLGSFLTAPITGEPDLLSVANLVPSLIGQTFTVSSVEDVAILEFDFIPYSDTVSFRYTFGSDEYLTYINSSFNDVFAFFISGPGITGPYSSPAAFPGGAKNIAVVPNSAPPLPITISSVQPSLNGQYYIDNPNQNTVGLNGFTSVFTAVSGVTCGETYHIKLALADGSDGSLKSAVFLEAGSFSSNGMVISAKPSYSNNTTGDTLLYEGCGDVTVTLVRGGDLTSQDTVRFEVTGTAINGVDYSNFPDSVVFVPGQDSLQITFSPLTDNLVENGEFMNIQVKGDTTKCGYKLQKLTLYLYDPIPLTLSAIHDTLDCAVGFAEAAVKVVTGAPGFTYNWSNGTNNTSDNFGDTIFVSPTLTSHYIVTVTDGCGLMSATASVEVFVPSFDVKLYMRDTAVVCPNDSMKLHAVMNGGLKPYTVWWKNSTGSGSGLHIKASISDYYTFYAADKCFIDVDSARIFVYVPTFNPLAINPLHDFQLMCPGNPINVLATATGGSGKYEYTWDNWTTTSNILKDKPLVTTQYTVIAKDNCTGEIATKTITANVPAFTPLSLVSNDSIFGCYADNISLHVNVTGGSGVYHYHWDAFEKDTNQFNVTLTETKTYSLLVRDACNNRENIKVHTVVLEPEANFLADYYDVDYVEFINLSSDDVIKNTWLFGDNTSSEEAEPQHSYEKTGGYIATLIVENSLGCIDSLTKLIDSPGIIWYPSAFTPNNDDLNDLWLPVHNGMINYQLKIFNRWGDVIFETKDPNLGWDGMVKGKIAEQGIYSYVLKGFSSTRPEEIEHKGLLTVVR